jgi:hypothetical protein
MYAQARMFTPKFAQGGQKPPKGWSNASQRVVKSLPDGGQKPHLVQSA